MLHDAAKVSALAGASPAEFVCPPATADGPGQVDAHPGAPAMGLGSQGASGEIAASADGTLRAACEKAKANWGTDNTNAINTHLQALNQDEIVGSAMGHNASAVLWYQLGSMMLYQDRVTEAVQCFERCANVGPTPTWHTCKYRLALTWLLRGRYEEAYKHVRRLPIGGGYGTLYRISKPLASNILVCTVTHADYDIILCGSRRNFMGGDESLDTVATW